MSLEILTRLHPDIKVRPSEEFSFSREIPTDFFDPDKLDTIGLAFTNLYSYLDMPYVFDLFPNHVERRVFKSGLEPDMLEAYENNALRKGRVNTIDLSLQLLSRLYLDRNDFDFFMRVDEAKSYTRTQFGDNYDTLTPDVKIDLAFGLKERVVSLLHYLEVKKDTSF